ncbi:MAG: SDR family NAD(P)-dependent oxidoreductase [Saprospiraceae bacterium]|nr:SDR family NAD(P)-dependent oxidoreductase [Saprospiraceae bacterium]
MQTINVLITGANSGLGFELAKQLAADGHGVLMCCRTLAKSNLAKSQILAAFPNAQLWACEMDLSSQESIYQCIEQLPVVADALVCNAAISYDGFHQYTKEGIELTFGVNHLGHFLLVKLLTEKFLALKKILIVASDLHNPEKSKSFFPKPSIEPIKHLAYPAPLSIESLKSAGALRYVNSKLCNVLFTYELARRFAQKQRAGVISAFNPGFMPSTNLSRKCS